MVEVITMAVISVVFFLGVLFAFPTLVIFLHGLFVDPNRVFDMVDYIFLAYFVFAVQLLPQNPMWWMCATLWLCRFTGAPPPPRAIVVVIFIGVIQKWII